MSLPGWDRQTKLKPPYGWLQWKNMEICMDVRCTCGHLSHFDDWHCYYLQCPACKRIYMVNGHVELVLLKADEVATLESDQIKQDIRHGG